LEQKGKVVPKKGTFLLSIRFFSEATEGVLMAVVEKELAAHIIYR